MKTTKTIAAVLAVFLALALFAGAGAALATGDVVYVYQDGALTPGASYYLWVNGAPVDTQIADVNGALAGEGITPGVYSDTLTATPAQILFTVKYPALTLGGYIDNGAGVPTSTSIAGRTLLATEDIDFIINGDNGINYGITFTTPAGGSTTTFGEDATAPGTAMSFADNLAAGFRLTQISLNGVASGEWKAVAKFKTGTSTLVPAVTKMESTTPSKYLASETLTFTVGSSVSEKVTVNKESITRGESVLVTFTGTPKAAIPVAVTGVGLMNLAGQDGITAIVTDVATGKYVETFTVTLSNTGTRTLQFNTDSGSEDKTYTIKANYGTVASPSYQSAKLIVKKGTVTITAAQSSYYVGNELTLSGTSTEGGVVYLYIKGTNKQIASLGTLAAPGPGAIAPPGGYLGVIGSVTAAVDSDHTWKESFSLPAGAYDAGTYTFYVSSSEISSTVPEFVNDIYDTTSVQLKQPFLTATAASSVVAKGDKIKIEGTAEAADNGLRYYVFGTNYFASQTISVNDDASYDVEVPTAGIDAGQYFVVVQHPMYDGNFNVLPIGTSIYMDSTGTPTLANFGAGTFTTTELFNTATRQSANAAEALCQALDSQNIDDIYVKLTFIVAQPTLSMNPVSDVAKGSALKVSGTTNVEAGKTVTVDVLSTAFTAIDKNNVNSASFITLSTKVVSGTNGVNTWEVTFDTTGLNVDSYTIQAILGDLTTSTIIKVTEAKPTATATATATKTATATATATATPTKTPGFGAFLALAGLGAVAVLVLRRD